MKKFDDRLDHSRMDRRRRQRIVDVGGVGPMSPDRVKCPFCSELILQDAIKCRFCGEWFSMPDERVSAGHVIGDNHPGASDQHGDHEAVAHVERRIVPGEAVENVGGRDYEAHEDRGDEHAERADDIEGSPRRVAREVIPSDGLATGLVVERVRRGIPWLRVLLLIVYLGAAGAMVVSELGAREVLGSAAKAAASDPNEAVDMYSGIVNDFPLSFAVIESRERLGPICESLGRVPPEPWWFLRIDGLFGEDVSPKNVFLLPLLAWPASALLLLVVFVTRVSRPGIAILALLLTIAAAAGAAVQFSSYGLIRLPAVADPALGLAQTPAAAYFAGYLALSIAALMTLTAAGKRESYHVAKMAMARTRRR